MMLRNIKIVFIYLDKTMMGNIITIMIGPKLEHADTVWSPDDKKKHTRIRKLEIIQRVAIRLIPEQNELSYEKRSKKIQLITLE